MLKTTITLDDVYRLSVSGASSFAAQTSQHLYNYYRHSFVTGDLIYSITLLKSQHNVILNHDQLPYWQM